MASALKGALKSAAGRSTSPTKDAEAQREAEKYRLHVTAGGSYNLATHKPVLVNTGEATYIENDFLRAKVQVRVRGYRGLPTSCPSSSPYFDDPSHHKDQYSLAFSFVPKVDLPSVDTVWGNDFDHPVRDRLPPGFNTAFKIVKEFIDPGLSCDAYADEPWLYGPSLSCWFAFVVGEKVGEDEEFAAPAEEHPMHEGGLGDGAEVRSKLGVPENNEKRRKYFLDAHHREQFTFEKGRCYQADFYNPYLDFGNFALKLPGFSLKVIKYVDQKSHNLRYVFKNRTTGDVYLNVNFGLLWGEDLAKALEAEKHDQRPGQYAGEEEAVAGATNGRSTSAANEDNERQSPSDSASKETNTAAAEVAPASTTANGEWHQSGQQATYDTESASTISDVPAVAGAEEAVNQPRSLHDDELDHTSTSVSHDLGADATPSTAGPIPLQASDDISNLLQGNALRYMTRDVPERVPAPFKPTVNATTGGEPQAKQEGSSDMDEISELLQATATSDRRGSARGIL
jgi:hypothetical protein